MSSPDNASQLDLLTEISGRSQENLQPISKVFLLTGRTFKACRSEGWYGRRIPDRRRIKPLRLIGHNTMAHSPEGWGKCLASLTWIALPHIVWCLGSV